MHDFTSMEKSGPIPCQNIPKIWPKCGKIWPNSPPFQSEFKATQVTALERVPIIETAAKAVVKSSSSKMSDTALHSSIDSDQSYLRLDLTLG